LTLKLYCMATSVLLEADSASNLSLLLELAKKLGIKSSLLSKEEVEDAKLGMLMSKEMTGKTVDEASVLKELKK